MKLKFKQLIPHRQNSTTIQLNNIVKTEETSIHRTLIHDRVEKSIHLTQIHDRSLSWGRCGTGPAVKID